MPEKSKAQRKVVATAEHDFRQPLSWIYYTNMKLLLTISERIFALALLNQFKGNLDTLVDVMEDIKGFRMTDEEWEKADKQVNTVMGEDGKPITSWTWNDEKGGLKEIEITKTTKEYLTEKIKESNDKGEFTLQDRAAITLSGKLEENKTDKKK